MNIENCYISKDICQQYIYFDEYDNAFMISLFNFLNKVAII